VLSLRNAEWLEGHDTANTLLRLDLKQEGAANIVQEHYFVPSKDLALQPANINVSGGADENGVHLVLESDVLAKQVWLSSDVEGVFSDNFFDLIPGIPVKVQFTSREGLQSNDVISNPGPIEVRSMIDFIRLT
jgi:beta-mannosidase